MSDIRGKWRPLDHCGRGRPEAQSVAPRHPKLVGAEYRAYGQVHCTVKTKRYESSPNMKPTSLVVLVPALLCAPLVNQVRAQAATGSGQYATALFPLAAGLAVFELEHQGEGSFIVRLLSDSGRVVDTLARAVGVFRGAKAARVPTTGFYLYDVSTAGRWSIRLRPVSTATAGGDVTSDAWRDGAAAGEQAARARQSTKWMLGGFASGAVAGPIGAGVVFLTANRRESSLSPDLMQSLAGKDPTYVQAFSEAYLTRRRSSRKAAAVVGGAVGTIVFTFAVIQIARWNDEGGGGGPNGNGETP
jgi:hypothetical protein